MTSVEFEWTITELATDEIVASGSAPTETVATREMERYAMQYSEDGPIGVQLIRTERQQLKDYRVGL